VFLFLRPRFLVEAGGALAPPHSAAISEGVMPQAAHTRTMVEQSRFRLITRQLSCVRLDDRFDPLLASFCAACAAAHHSCRGVGGVRIGVAARFDGPQSVEAVRPMSFCDEPAILSDIALISRHRIQCFYMITAAIVGDDLLSSVNVSECANDLGNLR